MSIKPKYCELISSGKKTVEVRKTKPKLETPFKCYIYCTAGGIKKMPRDYLAEHFERGKVIGEFVCDDVAKILNHGSSFWIEGIKECKVNTIARASCLDFADMKKYLGEKDGYAWHISNLVIYDKPKELSEFCLYNVRAYFDEKLKLPMPTHEIKRPPQSWCYVEEMG